MKGIKPIKITMASHGSDAWEILDEAFKSKKEINISGRSFVVSQANRYWSGHGIGQVGATFSEVIKAKNISAWNGEGLPPAGLQCEYLGAHQYDEWTVVTVFAHWKDQVFVDYGDGWRSERDLSRFRPIRTPEQIEADQVSKQLDSDLAMYGISFSLTNDDGSITRLDQTRIVMRKQEAK